jgi:hypothetical protein
MKFCRAGPRGQQQQQQCRSHASAAQTQQAAGRSSGHAWWVVLGSWLSSIGWCTKCSALRLCSTSSAIDSQLLCCQLGHHVSRVNRCAECSGLFSAHCNMCSVIAAGMLLVDTAVLHNLCRQMFAVAHMRSDHCRLYSLHMQDDGAAAADDDGWQDGEGDPCPGCGDLYRCAASCLTDKAVLCVVS